MKEIIHHKRVVSSLLEILIFCNENVCARVYFVASSHGRKWSNWQCYYTTRFLKKGDNMIQKIKIDLWDIFVYFISGIILMINIFIYFSSDISDLLIEFNSMKFPPLVSSIFFLIIPFIFGLILEPFSNFYQKYLSKLWNKIKFFILITFIL